MNLILIDETDRLSETRAIIKGRALKHARTILGAAEGESLRVGILNGPMGQARAIRDSTDAIEVEFEAWQLAPPPINLRLFIAMPRPKVLLRILQTAACLGIKDIHLLNAYRVEKSFWHCEQLQPARMDLALRLGLEQARDTTLPSLTRHRRLKPFAQDELPMLVAGQRALIAHPVAAEPCPGQGQQPTALAVGPEGGFIPYEIDLFVAAGFSPVHLGPRILKVETALVALTTRLTS